MAAAHLARSTLSHVNGDELVHGKFRYTVGIGGFPDERLTEIFIHAAKSGTEVEATARDAAIIASLAFQSGVSPETLRRALSRNGDGSAAGPLAAVLDLLARSPHHHDLAM